MLNIATEIQTQQSLEVARQALERIGRNRSRLLLDYPWFGSLALRLTPVCEPGIGLMATDGTHLYFDPEQTMGIPDKATMTVIAHEVLHCALLHPFRRGTRNPKIWNQACDHVVNLALQENGFTFPTGGWAGLKNPNFKGMTAEQVYEILKDQQDQDGGEGQDDQEYVLDLRQPPKNDPGPGKPQQAPGQDQGGNQPDNQPQDGQGSGAEAMDATDWEIAAEQATMVAKRAGKMPIGAERLIRQAREPKVDWREVLREFVTQTMPSDYSWANPNRRYVAQGLYLPGVVKENTAWGVVAIDTSGSVTQAMLEQAAGELTAILADTRPEKLVVIYCDAKVQGEPVEFTPDGGPVALEMRGGGGTMFQPVFDEVAKLSEEGDPNFLIYLTDLECYDAPKEPEYPVLWATTLKTSKVGPFGRTVHCDVEG